MKYNIGGLEFRTKEAVKKHCRDIIARYKDHEPILKDDQNWLLELLKGHPRAVNKIGCGVATIWCQKNPVWNNRGFWLKRTDGTVADFSFLECITGTPHAVDVARAFRVAISDQILEFRNRHFAGRRECICPVSGEALTIHHNHVDHAPPLTFDHLFHEFLASSGLEIDKIEVVGHEDGVVVMTLADKDLEARWSRYHKERCVLRVVSPKANLSTIKVEKR